MPERDQVDAILALRMIEPGVKPSLPKTPTGLTVLKRKIQSVEKTTQSHGVASPNPSYAVLQLWLLSHATIDGYILIFVRHQIWWSNK